MHFPSIVCCSNLVCLSKQALSTERDNPNKVSYDAASQRGTSNEVHPISHKGYCVHHIFTWGYWYSDIWNVYPSPCYYLFSCGFNGAFVDIYLQHLSEVNPRAPYWWSFNFGSGSGLVLLCPKPFPGPMFTKCAQWKSDPYEQTSVKF